MDETYTPEKFRDEINRRRRESGKFDPNLGPAATEGPEGFQGPIETDRTPDQAFAELEERLTAASELVRFWMERERVESQSTKTAEGSANPKETTPHNG